MKDFKIYDETLLTLKEKIGEPGDLMEEKEANTNLWMESHSDGKILKLREYFSQSYGQG